MQTDETFYKIPDAADTSPIRRVTAAKFEISPGRFVTVEVSNVFMKGKKVIVDESGFGIHGILEGVDVA